MDTLDEKQNTLLHENDRQIWVHVPCSRRTTARHASDTPQAAAEVRAALDGDALFIQALRDDSHLEQDWFWLADQVARDWERQYCLARVLTINPKNKLARQELEAFLSYAPLESLENCEACESDYLPQLA